MVKLDEILIDVVKLPPVALEHFGSPCTMQEIEVTVLGVIRVTYTSPIPEDEIIAPDDMDFLALAAQSLAEELDAAQPIVVKSEDGEISIRLIAFTFGVVSPTEAIGTVLEWDIVK